MPIKAHAAKDFLKKEPGSKAAFGAAVVGNLDAPPAPATFPALPYSTTVLGHTNDALIAAIAAAMSGDHHQIDLRDAAEHLWDIQFGATADYVSTVAAGDETIISLAGFAPTKTTRTPKGKPGRSRIKKVVSGRGSATIDMDAQPEADAMMYILAPVDGSVQFGADGMATITMGGKKAYIKCSVQRDVTFGGLDKAELQIAVQPVNTAGAGDAATGETVTPQ